MATITRIEAIEQIQKVLKAYACKIYELRHDAECLPPAGKAIIDSYCCNENEEQNLIRQACLRVSFFKNINNNQLLDFYVVCYGLNEYLGLGVKDLIQVTDVTEDKESFWESFWGALQGEFNEDPSGASILIDMGLNFIPFVGQVLDARDILACLDKLIRQKRTHEIMIWVTLVLTAIGCVPYAGDVIKAIGKAIVKGADDIIITLLKKLDAEDVYKAFIKFYNKLNESLEEAIKIINQWLLEAEKRYNETDLSELIRNANEYIRKAIEFIQTKIDEFAQKMFGKGNITLDVKLLEETSSNSKKTIKFVNGQITGEITNALKTEPGTAFFWSGCAKVDPSSGKLLVSGDEVAAEIANKCGGTTLETQIKVNNIEMPKWDFDVPESIKAWEDTSAAYAKQVSGDVRAIVGPKLRPENIWENIELPRLMQNPNVSKITTIDPDTLAETVIFERKAGGKVYIKPNETLVKNGEWDKIIDNLEKNGNKIDDEVKKANLLDKNGEFSDVKIESDYQKYIKRKKQKGETPRDRLDWKEQSDYWRNESPIARGNNYNKIVRNSNIYPYHEIHLENGKRLDSYDMLAGEIISRKATDLDKISEDTFRKYLSEFKEKYSKGTKIRSNTYPQLDGMELNGQYILEIPATNAMLSDIDYYKKIAEEYDVILRFTEEIKCLN